MLGYKYEGSEQVNHFMPRPQRSFIREFTYIVGQEASAQVDVMDRINKQFRKRIVYAACAIVSKGRGVVYVEFMYPLEIAAFTFKKLNLEPNKLLRVKARENVLAAMKEYDSFWEEKHEDRELAIQAFLGSKGKVILDYPRIMQEAYKTCYKKMNNSFLEELDKIIEK